MAYAIKVCRKCGGEFVASGLGIATQQTCDMCCENRAYVSYGPTSQTFEQINERD